MTTLNREISSLRSFESVNAEPIDVLFAEHRITEQALNCLERMAERWSSPAGGDDLDWTAVHEAIVFFQTFVEDWHFRREEAYFAASGVRLESIEIHESGKCTFHDHQRCATHLRGLAEAVEFIASRSTGGRPDHLDPATPAREDDQQALRAEEQALQAEEIAAARRRFGEHARAYVDILLKHIENEEDFMYPIIVRDAPPQTKRAAAAVFRQVSRETIDAEKLNECLAAVGNLVERFVGSAKDST